MSEQVTRKCPCCGNAVIGVFKPSTTRKFATAAAKKGGMKTVLAAAGSVIPGFGNVAGFVAGTAIDVLAGDKINKFIDDVADAFDDDNKVYQFSCPNCGHEWRDTGEESVGLFSGVYGEKSVGLFSGVYDGIGEENENQYELQFNQFLDDILDKYGQISQIDQLKGLFISIHAATPMDATDEVRSKYAYTAAMLALDGVLQNWQTLTDAQKEYYLNRADDSIESALNAIPDSAEYQLIRDTIYSLKHRTVEEQLAMGDMGYWYFEDDFEDTIFKFDFLRSLYDTSRYLIVSALVRNEDDEKVQEQLWKLLLSSNNVRHLEDVYLSLYFILDDTDTSEKLSTEAHRFLTKGYELKDFETAVADKDEDWLFLMEEYAVNLANGRLLTEPQDFQRGFAMLQQVAQTDFPTPAQKMANISIGMFYEIGEHVSPDLDQALLYYRKADHEEGIKRVSLMMKELSETGTSSAQGNCRLSEVEQEYLDEVKACIADDGEITASTRRLLDKLARKLGLDGDRVHELEQSLSVPQLTEDEQEYLEEYRECLASDNRITSSERRLLDKLRVNLGISSERAAELEAMEGN